MQTFFKSKQTATKARRVKARKRKLDERLKMRDARQRDKECRFPRCPCRSLGLATEVAHLEHRGMGGDPTGIRTDPSRLILLCAWRHQRSPYSLDRKTLACVPLTSQGTHGPVAWDVRDEQGAWRRLYTPRVPLTPWQLDVLLSLERECLRGAR